MSITPTLPEKGKLSAEQGTVLTGLDYYSDDDAIIIGGPGTGKSILAAYRAVEASKNKENVLLLVFNVPLQKYIHHAIKKTIATCEVKTYFSWLWSFYNENKFFFNKDTPPRIEQYKPNWKAISEDFVHFSKAVNKTLYSEVIVDEAQDVPIQLIQCLKLISNRVVCFIDPAQTFKNGQATVKDLESIFCDPFKKELKINYRNTKQIAEAAAIFSNNNLSYNFSNGNGPVTKPVMWDCENNIDLVIRNMSDIIRKHYKNKSIGIILSALPGKDETYPLMDRYCNLLKKELGNKYAIQCYKSKKTKDEGELDFGRSGIKVFNYNTVKGIDFDIVLLPIVEPIISDKNPDTNKSKVYVALSRGREECYLFYGNIVKSQNRLPIYDILPIIKEHKSKFDWWKATDSFQKKYQ